MYFLRTKRLAAEIAHGGVSVREAKNYYIAWTVLAILVGWGFLTEPSGSGAFRLSTLLEAGALLATLVICYQSIRPIRTSEFLTIMVCIAWPEIVKLAFVAGLLVLLLNPAWHLGLSRSMQIAVIDLIGWIVLLAVCIRLISFVRFIKSQRGAAAAVFRANGEE